MNYFRLNEINRNNEAIKQFSNLYIASKRDNEYQQQQHRLDLILKLNKTANLRLGTLSIPKYITKVQNCELGLNKIFV